MLFDFFKNYFGFNKQQRNGLAVLLLISLLLFILQLTLPLLKKQPELRIKNLPFIKLSHDTVPGYTNKSFSVSSQILPTLHLFDPNTADKNELLKLGLSPKSVKALINYRNKGFVFKNKTDLLKVYGLTANDYKQLEPYILIDNKETALVERNININTEKFLQQVKPQVLELNSADSLQLLTLKGVGPVFSKRIIKYRSLLGGFENTGQLKEVYGMKPEILQEILPQVKVDPSLIKKIRLNSEDFKKINAHPYISYELTRSIYQLRKGTKITESTLSSLISDKSEYMKLLPYCDFD
jgi:competence protein ComEA